jgi:hypothetical protein
MVLASPSGGSFLLIHEKLKEVTVPITFRSECKDGCLRVVAKGSVYAVHEMVDYFKRLHDDLTRAGLLKLLVIETECNIHLSLDGLRRAAEEGRKLKWREDGVVVAVVSSDMNHPLFRHVFDPMEEVRIFSREQEAMEWLARG